MSVRPVDETFMAEREEVESDKRRLKFPGGGGTFDDMSDAEAPWDKRVSRLEMGFCGAFVLIFAAIIASYLMLARKIDDNGDKIANAITAQADTRGDIKVLNERTANMDKKLDAISDKLDRKH